MKLNSPNVNTVSSLISRSPFKKPKVVTATVLISIMAFMWVKVLVNHRAEKNEARAASARTAAQQAAAGQQEELVKITLHPLPVVPGRNDVLTHDMFTADRWKAFPSNNRNASGTFPKEIDRNDAGYIDKIAETIILEAVISGANPEAFI